MVHTYEEALQASEKYFEGHSLAAKVVVDKYLLRNQNNELIESNPDEMHWRMAIEFARVENNKFSNPYPEEFIYQLFKDFQYIIPQGSIMYGLGNSKQVSLSNCYVTDLVDSYGGIHKTDQHISQISKRRGGIGFDISALRPIGTLTRNSSRSSTGIVPFMQRFSNTVREVGQDGRRAASLQSISVHHPQVLDFINIKRDLTKVTGANLSVRLTNEFLSVIDNNADYEQRWPVDSTSPKISIKIKAKKIWDSIIDAAWTVAEPCVVFWDNIVSQSPADCYSKFGFSTISLNPCAELPLSNLDSCRLLLLNLFSFVKNPFTKEAFFDFEMFYKYVQIAQRLMDDVIDLELECIDRIINKVKADHEEDSIKQEELSMWIRIRENCFNGRRTGTGPTALGDTLAALGVKYGSEQSIEITEKIYKTLKFGAYRASVDIAKERGPFPIWNQELEQNNPFLLRLKNENLQLSSEITISGNDIYEEMSKFGRSNIALLTTAPAGTASILAGPRPFFETTSGIEPAFKVEYFRKKKINHSDKNVKVDFIDKNMDKWQEFPVYHSKLKLWMQITGETDIKKSPYYGACAEEIDWKQRVKLQAAATKHCDHSISSTINLPNNVSREEVAEIFTTAWKAGCKGITVYRSGCRDGVLTSVTAKTENINHAKKRPKELPCDVYFVSVKKEEFFVIVGISDGTPYEVFAGRNSPGIIDKREKSGMLIKDRRKRYRLMFGEDLACPNIVEGCSDSQETVTRLISTSLRHKIPLGFIIHQIEKVEGDLQSFAKSIVRVLKKYLPEGDLVHGEECPECKGKLVRSEGCAKCMACGWTKCS